MVTVTLHCVTLNSGEKRPGVLLYRIIDMRGEEMFAGEEDESRYIQKGRKSLIQKLQLI